MKWNVLVVCLLAAQASAETPFDNRKPDPKATKAGYSGLGAESVTPADIAKYVAPALDERVSRRIQAMLDVRGAGSGLITSKGDRMVFGSRVTGTPQIWRQDGPMKFAVQLTGGEDRTTAVALAPDDSFVVVSRDIGGSENPGLYLMSFDGGALTLVQHTPKVQTSLAFVSDDSKSLYFRANDIDPDSYAIYRWDIKTAKRELVFEQKGLWSVADHQGDSWLLTKALGSTQIEVYQYDLKSKQLTPLLGQNESEEYDVAFGGKPGQVLVRTNKPADFQRVYALDHGKLTPITPDLKFDVESFTIDEPRTRIYYRINEHGYAKLAAMDARTFKPIALPTLPEAENINLGGVSRNGRFVQLAIDGSTLAPQSVTFDWQTRKLTTWRVPMTPEIDTRKFAKGTLEYYPTRDGAKIPMFVRRPASCSGPCPVVVELHGGPEGQSMAGFNGTAQLYVDAGFVFVQPNVRGSTGYGKAWLHSDDGPRRLSVISDIEDCAKYIRANWGKDGKAPKIGVEGGSYGGYSTLMAMTLFAGAFDAGVSNVGISNLMTFLINTAPYRRILRISEYGDPVRDKEALVQLSPITHIARIKAPLMIIQGVNDPRVPVGEAVQMYKELERRKIPGGLILFPDEGHGAAKRGNIVLTIGHSIAFFEKHLLTK
ncbi:MAG: Acylamino-acid-releasing enzyme [Deltaproteobacteria bacterium]|nr:Acylamino-acid-releasing enzyme [Deltaproteobacteria bacterium]